MPKISDNKQQDEAFAGFIVDQTVNPKLTESEKLRRYEELASRTSAFLERRNRKPALSSQAARSRACGRGQ